MCQSELTEFDAELSEFAQKLSEFSLPKQYSRNSIPPVPHYLQCSLRLLKLVSDVELLRVIGMKDKDKWSRTGIEFRCENKGVKSCVANMTMMYCSEEITSSSWFFTAKLAQWTGQTKQTKREEYGMCWDNFQQLSGSARKDKCVKHCSSKKQKKTEGVHQNCPQYCWEFHDQLWEALSRTISEKEASPAVLRGREFWKCSGTWIIGFGGSQPYSRGQFQERISSGSPSHTVRDFSRGGERKGRDSTSRWNVCAQWCRDTRTVTRVRHHLLCLDDQNLRDNRVTVLWRHAGCRASPHHHPGGHAIVESLRGNRIGATGPRASEREICLWEGLWEGFWGGGFQRFSKIFQRFSEIFQRFSEIFQSFSEVLSETLSVANFPLGSSQCFP